MSKDLRFAMLLDCYGEFLTPHQYRMTELYYCADLSLGEIAEMVGITRQGVRDAIKRAEQQLMEMEDRLGLAKRFKEVQDALTVICDCAVSIQERNSARDDDPEIRKNVARILERAKEIAIDE